MVEQIPSPIDATLADNGLMHTEGAVVGDTLIAAPSSTKNEEGERDPEMHQTNMGIQWHFGMKANIGVDAYSGLVHGVGGTAANANDFRQANKLVHGEEADVFADAGYQSVAKREKVQDINGNWHVAKRSGKWKALDKDRPMGAVMDKLGQTKARIRAKIERPFRVAKPQFGHQKVRYRRAGQEHCATAHVVCALQSVDSAVQAFAWDAGMSASANGQSAVDKGEKPLLGTRKTLTSPQCGISHLKVERTLRFGLHPGACSRHELNIPWDDRLKT